MKWNLDDIMPLDKFDNLYREVEGEIKTLEKWVEKVNPKMSQKEFGQMLEFNEEMGVKIAKLAYLPELIEAVDQKNQKAKLMKSRVDNLGLKISDVATKLGLWIQGKREPILDDKNAMRLFATISDLEYGLKRNREGARFSLNEREEQIIDHKDVNGVGVLSELREMIETEFEYRLKVEKLDKKISSQAELLAYVYNPKPEIRKAAYTALLQKQKENLDKFFAIYQGIVKDWGYETRLRGHMSPISVRNWANHVPDGAVESLLKVCSRNLDIFQRYFKWKAQKLGLKKLQRYDIYAPLQSKDKKITYEEAKKQILSTLRDFSLDFEKKAKKIIEEKHIDVNPGKSKRGGAFCATVAPEITPYILLNFTGKSRDISTLAHELGHGIHSLFASKHYPSSQQANLPLAETASTLCELILFEKMMKNEKDKEIKKAWLSDKMADAYATICRQNYFIKFEIEAHREIEKGISAEDLSKLYLKTLKEQFGSSIEIDPLFKYEWSYISHIFESPFYCYAYNFGELVSYALFASYKKEPKKWIKIIEKILESGGSEDPQKVLKRAGVDINDDKFWQKSFETIEEWQNELENL
ncbi:MAG: M3 family oligoendopeptidase [Candidatus Shapirobacteria bacterium]|nr:M3 family oligoendopeptidase [Candidatus Shapirobacteria bacterium]